MNLENLTAAELKEFEILVRLGDSAKLAYETVINERARKEKQNEANDFYRLAYES